MSPPPFRLPGHNKASEPGDSAIPVAAAAAVAAKSLPLAPSASIASTATTSATTPPRVTDRRQSKTRSLHKRVVSDPELASRPPSSLLLNQDSTSHSPVGAGGSIRNNWNSPSSPNDAIEAFRTISRAMRGLKLPSSPHSTHRSHTSPNSDAISLAQSQILSEVEVEAIKNANDILDKHFSPGNAGSSRSKLNPRRRYQIYPHSQSTTSLDRAPFQSAAPTPALSALSCESVLRDRHDSIMTINFSEDVNTDSPFDAEASIKGHQVAKRARKVEKLLGTDVDKSAIIKSFKKQNKLWFLEPTYEKFDISFDMEGNVDGGTWDALIEYLTPPHPTPQDYEITFLLTFRAFATPRQFCDALIRRYRQQPPPGLGIHEIKLWQEKMQRVVQMKVYHIFRSWYEIYWFGAEDDECLPRVTEFLSTEVSKNPKLTGNKLRMCHKLIAKMEERMRNESNWLSRGNAPHTQQDMPRHAVDTAATSRRRPSASNPTSTSHGLSLFRRPIKIGHSNSPPRSAHLQQSPSLGTRNHNFLFNRLRSHSQNNSSTSSKPRNEHALFSGSLFNSRRNGQQQQQQQDDHTVVAIRAKSGSDVSIRYQQQQMPEPLQSDPQSLRFRPRRPSEASIRSVDSSGSYVDSNTQGSDVEAEVAELLRVTVGVDLTFDMLRRMSNITQLPPNQIAIQITILQSGCFCKIQPYELLRGEFSKKNSLAANVKNMTKWNTQISRWVSYSILKEQTPERRCRILKYFIRVGAECLHMKNYDAVMAIQGALNSAAVLRLKKTWALLPSKLNRVNTRLQMATKSDRNYSEYRRMLRNSEPPLLPFLGMYLTDLTFINDGNPDMRRRKLVSAVGMDDKTWEKQREHENLKAKAINTSTLANKDDIDITSKAILINFDKYYKIARIIREIQKFQVEYKGNFLTTMPALSDYLVSEWDRLDEEGIDEDLLYNMSLKREPREVVLQPQPPPPSVVCSSSVASLGSGGGGSGHGQNNIASQSKVSPPSDNGHKQSSQLPSQPLTKEQEILDSYMNW
ncbi:hypothetical protein EV182_001157 [Spiromyces aspiralis]|uniref:Uncharacterized protein n=1 Tax=Spiromyces aspiralis TaxID=68401 RepID=A0ACC1I161_9FUNG|nr:hypothetical protein EV182_001157 [Spiromyces aspiralis]